MAVNLTFGLIGLIIIIIFVALAWIKFIKTIFETIIYFSGSAAIVCFFGIVFYIVYTDYTIGDLFRDYVLNLDKLLALEPFKMVYHGWEAAMEKTGIGQSIDDLIGIQWDFQRVIDWFKSLKFW